MKKLFYGLICVACVMLAGCKTMNSTYSVLSPSGNNYNRSTVCENLRQQIGFNADQGYSATNLGPGQVQQQQLLAAYQANGCDK
ncbi:MAG: hypothetical protein ACK4PR_08150 [Gammaproteobacteria bacterium]